MKIAGLDIAHASVDVNCRDDATCDVTLTARDQQGLDEMCAVLRRAESRKGDPPSVIGVEHSDLDARVTVERVTGPWWKPVGLRVVLECRRAEGR